MSEPVNYIMVNGRCIPEKEAAIPAVTSGLYYGAGAFDTFLSEKGKIFKFKEHMDRLLGGLHYLGVAKDRFPHRDAILDQIRTLLGKKNLQEKITRVRIQVSLTEQHGYSGMREPPFLWIITADEVQKNMHPLKLILSKTPVIPASARPARFKLSNMLHYRHAFQEAEQKGADDAVMLNIEGFVAETSVANIFWIKNGNVFTPSEECDILPGIMRNSMIDVLANRVRAEVNEGKFAVDHLLEADSVWITNSALDFIAVSGIDEVSFKTEGNFFLDLRNHLSVYKKENMSDV